MCMTDTVLHAKERKKKNKKRVNSKAHPPVCILSALWMLNRQKLNANKSNKLWNKKLANISSHQKWIACLFARLCRRTWSVLCISISFAMFAVDHQQQQHKNITDLHYAFLILQKYCIEMQIRSIFCVHIFTGWRRLGIAVEWIKQYANGPFSRHQYWHYRNSMSYWARCYWYCRLFYCKLKV